MATKFSRKNLTLLNSVLGTFRYIKGRNDDVMLLWQLLKSNIPMDEILTFPVINFCYKGTSVCRERSSTIHKNESNGAAF